MKFNIPQSKIRFVAVFSVSLFILQFAFQNCSPRTAGFKVTGEIGQDSSYVAPVTRNLSVSPITDKIENDQPIKVLIIVDDSQTMQNSQTNLARSMTNLAALLSNYDAEIMVITTSSEKFIESVSQTPVLTATTRTNVVERGLKAAQPTYKFLKSQTAAQKNTVVTSLSNAIKAVGTSGYQNEKPLYSMALALGSETFLKPNDNVLIYVITDEDDVDSKNVNLASYLKKETKLTQLSSIVDHPFYNVDGYVYNRRFFRGTWNEPGDSGGGNCGSDDLGNPIPCGGGGGGSGSSEYNTYSECWADVNGRLAGNCQQVDQSPKERLNGSTVAEACASIRANYPNQITSCGATVIRAGGPENVPEKLLSTESVYFADFNLSTESLQAKLIKHLNSKFGGSYLIAAQVNIEGQACEKGQGQSYDNAFKAFEALAPKGRFIRSSICDEAAVSGDVLREIATQLTVNITNQYAVVLDVSERILTMTAVRGPDRIPLVEGKDFTYANNIVKLTSLNATDFDYLDVGIGKKENWKD